MTTFQPKITTTNGYEYVSLNTSHDTIYGRIIDVSSVSERGQALCIVKIEANDRNIENEIIILKHEILTELNSQFPATTWTIDYLKGIFPYKEANWYALKLTIAPDGFLSTSVEHPFSIDSVFIDLDTLKSFIGVKAFFKIKIRGFYHKVVNNVPKVMLDYRVELIHINTDDFAA